MPAHDQFKRRVTTVLFADVVGYTRLSENDEAGTHRALRAALSLISDTISEYEGLVVHFAGDGVLCEFSSVIDGLNCAVAIQRTMATRSELSSGESIVRLRIGINVGDVIDDEGEIYGDTVNTTVRLQSVAEPGGICISEAVRNAMGRQLPVAYEFVGEERLKNLSIPVRAYRVLIDGIGFEESTSEANPKPSLAVLPFENFGATLEEADVLTEGIVRELSRFHGFEVIAHSSTATYKGVHRKAQQVAEELGADYLIEGHIRRTADGVQVNVQLVYALSGHHLWSELFQQLESVSNVGESDLIRRIVAATAGRIHVASGELAQHRPTQELHAFEHVLRGQMLVGKGHENNALSRTYYQRALALDPCSARAFSGIALSYIDDWWNSWTEDAEEMLMYALQAAQRAYGADTTDSKVHWVLGLVHCLRGELQQATRLAQRGNQLNPNDADGFALDVLIALYQGDAGAAREALTTAFMLNPFPPAWYRWLQGTVSLATGDAVKARLELLEALQQNPELHIARVQLAAAYVELGDLRAVREQTDGLERRFPGVTSEQIVARVPVPAESKEILRCALDAAMR